MVIQILISINAFIQRIVQTLCTKNLINETETKLYQIIFVISTEMGFQSKVKEAKHIWFLFYSLLNLLDFSKIMRQ